MTAWTALKIFGFLVAAVAIILGSVQTGFWPSNWLHDELASNIEDSTLKSYVLSHDPLVVYVKNFITPDEAIHLVSLA
jgi:prolyl 4-hydroxylase